MHAYFDCFAGIAGDMTVAALCDCGIPEAELRAFVDSLGLTGFAWTLERTKRKGIAALRFAVKLDMNIKQPHRHLHHVERIIDELKVAQSVKERSKAIFRRLAEAEAKIHATTIEKVHFHEVGAVDAILDIVCAAWCLDRLGVYTISASPVPTGVGSVQCEHGLMPIPAPATAELLTGVPLAPCEVRGELTTPTGAALVATLAAPSAASAAAFGPPPAMTLRRIGYGAGAADRPERANVLRIMLGDPVSADAGSDEVVVLETNLDDASPEIAAFCQQRLLEQGALDAYIVPITMKKGRLGHLLGVICEPNRADELESLLFAETPTFGVRRHTCRRSVMSRRHETAQTRWGPIRLKIGEWRNRKTISPEYEDCRAAAMAHGVALREVYEAALRGRG